MVDQLTLVQMGGVATAVAVPVGGLVLWGVRLGISTWIKRIEERLNDAEAGERTITGDVRVVAGRVSAVEVRVAALELAREEQWRLLQELKRLLSSLHERMDDHAIKDSKEREDLARELGALNQAVRGRATSGGDPIA